MGAGWEIIAFPVILPWQKEFWTLPLYFSDLRVGVLPGWPAGVPYQSMDLPPEAEVAGRELKGWHPGDLSQWRAFADFAKNREETDDIIQALRGGPSGPQGRTEQTLDPWKLAWQMEKMQADQEAQLLRVDQGQEWLAEILAPEPWEERPGPGAVPGVREMVDPELAWARYRLWRRVMASYLEANWAPFLLGRSARAIFLTLKGWPQWTQLKRVQVSLPGCRSEAEFRAARDKAAARRWPKGLEPHLTAVLDAAAADQDMETAAQELRRFVETEITRHWPAEPTWHWELEIWAKDPESEDLGPALGWAGAGAGILPG